MPRRSKKSTMSRHGTRSRDSRSPIPLAMHSGHRRVLVQDTKSASLNTRTIANNSPTKPAERGGSASSGTSNDEAANDEDESSDVDAQGEGDDEDEEPKVFAPSDEPVHIDSSQTGLVNGSTALSGTAVAMKRKLRSSSSDDDEIKRPRKATKALKGRSNAVHNSDDDDYDGVDNIGGADEDEPTVEELEEMMIINSEEENNYNFGSPIIPAAPPSVSSDGWPGFELNGGMFVDEVPFFQEQIGRADPSILALEIEAFNSAVEEDSGSTPSPPTRRVRFVDDVYRASSSTSTDGSDADEDPYPDLFLQQDSLDPSFRRIIENDGDGDNGQSMTDSEGSFLAFDDNEDFELEKHGLNDDSSSNCGNSSGYETDEGETTDEEVLPPATITRPQSLLRRDSSSSLSEAAKLMPAPVRTATTARSSTAMSNMRRQGPCMGSWVADPTKPIAVIDGTGKRMVIYPAQRPKKVDKILSNIAGSGSSSTTTSPRNSFASLARAFDDSENDRSDFSSREFAGPMLGAGVNLMIPGLLRGAPGMEHIHSGQVLGPPEAFYPFKSIGADGNILNENDEIDDDEDLWDLEDFIDFGDDSSDDDKEVAEGTNVVASTMTGGPPGSVRGYNPQSTASGDSTAQNLLDHFDRGVVTAFRRNQHRHQTLLRRPPINAAISGPHGVKNGRHVAANSPISPLRKRKATGSLHKGGSLLPGVVAKRRVSNPHKRSKSTL